MCLFLYFLDFCIIWTLGGWECAKNVVVGRGNNFHYRELQYDNFHVFCQICTPPDGPTARFKLLDLARYGVYEFLDPSNLVRRPMVYRKF